MRCSLLFLLLPLALAQRVVRVKHSCDNIPSLPNTGPGCGVPDYIPNFDVDSFGDNNNTIGFLRISRARGGLQLRFRIVNIPVPDLVLTAWIQWIDPLDGNKPDVFKVAADYVSPCAPFDAPFFSGLGREPNEFRYVSPTSAVLRARLNFNPTYANEGPLHRMVPCFQRDVPGIQRTPQRQFPNPRTGEFVPSASSFLRKYDPATGFELRDADGRPELIRSPTRALAIIVASHLDRLTHGVTPGNFMTDHYDLMVFKIGDIVLGKPTVAQE